MPQHDVNVPKKLFRVSEVAEALGICKSDVERLIKSGDLPSLRIGRSLRGHAEDLDAWLEARRLESSRDRGSGAA
ncbi:MAG: DNA-binding protein [Alphaproteobacteria bacterium]|nr:MAG: DNA-binding protein [Alphaproteobacteria bacterium]